MAGWCMVAKCSNPCLFLPRSSFVVSAQRSALVQNMIFNKALAMMPIMDDPRIAPPVRFESSRIRGKSPGFGARNGKYSYFY
ncbi:hypothetical protein M378DRAFT_536890 [Amanita muscaria Koide BX008]|uniref:Uncharacterized protein n=1 Tax=Amanita muscaria (strain Koide BX008) TaxID=946122 RepID=A0A0C2X937_AMAMK|nr:hypothetical protein M378DRAFT_536890 [Amanita muscaria Koide BX008]